MAASLGLLSSTVRRILVISQRALPSSLTLRSTHSARVLSDGPAMGEFISMPKPVSRKGESLEVKRARLLYQSRKRGMLENGLILSNFADRYLTSMSDEDLDSYDQLINTPSNDWDIYYWATGKNAVPEEYRSTVMDALKEFVQNRDKKNRSRQPDLLTLTGDRHN